MAWPSAEFDSWRSPVAAVSTACGARSGLAAPATAHTIATAQIAASESSRDTETPLITRGGGCIGVPARRLNPMAYTSAEARQELLDYLAEAIERIGLALAALGAAYEQLDEHNA